MSLGLDAEESADFKNSLRHRHVAIITSMAIKFTFKEEFLQSLEIVRNSLPDKPHGPESKVLFIQCWVGELLKNSDESP